MGSIFKKVVTRPLSAGAEIIERKGVRLARWKDAKGKVRTAKATTGQDGSDRLQTVSSTYYARYRDGSNLVVEKPTGCRDESAARQVLAEWERKAERIRAGLMSSAEARTVEHQNVPIGQHVAGYIESMKARSVVEMHRDNTRRHLETLNDACGFARLADLNREALERWLAAEADNNRSARSRNAHRTALVSFCNWCVSTGRLTSNPFKGVPKANEAADPRRRRRAMTETELVALLDVARRRPLLDAQTIRRGKRAGEAEAKVKDHTRARLEAAGRERALIYKTLVLTGLRKGELASLTVAQLKLDGPVPHVELDAADEKNREGSGVAIRADLAADLRSWLDDRLATLQATARSKGEPIPARLPGDILVFDVPAGLRRIFDRDLAAAGIQKRDERGRTLDVHALRTTFGTLLSKGGVPLRTAQEAMRHSDPSLTANVYTDPKLLDIHGALNALPSLPLDATDRSNAQAIASASDVRPVALSVALTYGNGGTKLTMGDKTSISKSTAVRPEPIAVSACPDNEKGRLTTRVNRPSSVGATGFEPATSRPPV